MSLQEAPYLHSHMYKQTILLFPASNLAVCVENTLAYTLSSTSFKFHVMNGGWVKQNKTPMFATLSSE